MAKCSLFKRHQWGWVKNLWHPCVSPHVRATLRGLYRCDCGESKYGAPQSPVSPEASP